MTRTLTLCLGTLLLIGCGRESAPTETDQASAVQLHVMLTTTRLPDGPVDEETQILIEATILTCTAETLAKLGGEVQRAGVRVFEDQSVSVTEIFDQIDGVKILQMPSIVTKNGEEAFIEIADDDGSTVTLRASPTAEGEFTTVVLDYVNSKPDHTAKATVVLPDRGTAIVTAK